MASAPPKGPTIMLGLGFQHVNLGRTQHYEAPLVAQLVKNLVDCGRPGFDPCIGKIPREGNGYPLQDTGLENSMAYIVLGVSKSWTQLSDLHSQRCNRASLCSDLISVQEPY